MTTFVIPSDWKERRAFLKNLSQGARPHVNSGKFKNVNLALIAYYARHSGAKTLLSSKHWKERGYQVRKDVTGFPIWGRPRKAKRLVEDENGTRKESYEFFRVAHLYSEHQVEKIEG